jgi:ubiquinone/menaquinone biosynthesis C-methylase UbiE
VALIGEADYQENKFDLITSMDSIYFAPDMSAFLSQIYRWLKPNGTFICGYQEGDVMKKTENYDTSVLARAFRENGLSYKVYDYTKETFEMLKRKREAIISMKKEFKSSGIGLWYKVVKRQTDCIKVSYEEYRKKNARYIYTFTKENHLPGESQI